MRVVVLFSSLWSPLRSPVVSGLSVLLSWREGKGETDRQWRGVYGGNSILWKGKEKGNLDFNFQKVLSGVYVQFKRVYLPTSDLESLRLGKLSWSLNLYHGVIQLSKSFLPKKILKNQAFWVGFVTRSSWILWKKGQGRKTHSGQRKKVLWSRKWCF